MLALVDADYRFLWVVVGFSSDAETLKNNKLEEKIEDGTLGLLVPRLLEERGPNLHFILLGDNTFILMPWFV